ncbi:hypothetical protein ANCDUO_09833 [Ancylostoma duodenale]|uniref:Protein kinase domain-containing protein n=1 Tax=Ancylostoma duodenale TaxID=51022 RepID=A0A0C2GLV3_9BILA|nr:hypothetical protein ANCDUO_09833 [Ancylostoma duodenale]
MKVIKPKSPHQKQLALREVHVMDGLRHPSIVLLDYGFKDKKKIVLLLEYCDMGTLKQLLGERGKLENQLTANRTLVAIASGRGAAAQVHRKKWSIGAVGGGTPILQSEMNYEDLLCTDP